MINNKQIFNCENTFHPCTCKKCCLNKNKCNQNINFLDSLYCVENFLCNSQKACTLYKIFSFFR